MLRIVTLDEPHSTTLKLEGRLVSDWIPEAHRTWLEAAKKINGKQLIVDMFGLTFVDDPGCELLSMMHAAGARLVGSGPMVSGLIEEIESERVSESLGTFLRTIFLLSLMMFISLLSLPATAHGQTGRTLSDLFNDKSDETIVVNVWAKAAPTPAASGEPSEALSREFMASGLKATTLLREWQRHMAYPIQNGYPLSEFWIRIDRDRALDAVRLAELSAATAGDQGASRQLLQQYENLRLWSDWLIEANRNLRLAQYYMSPAALDNDLLFQKTVDCTKFLIPMLASGKLTEDGSCR